MALSAIFGASGCREKEVATLCHYRYTNEQLYRVLEDMAKDDTFLAILYSPY
jgi:hypothetical protein